MKKCLECNLNKDERNYITYKKKKVSICNECLIKRHKDKYENYKNKWALHFKCKEFLYNKKLLNWNFSEIDIFRLIDYLDFYEPTLAITVPIYDENDDSPLLHRVVNECKTFEENLLTRLIQDGIKNKPRYCKTNVPGIYLIGSKYHVYIYRNRKTIFVGSFITLEEAIMQKIAFKEKYAGED